MAPNISFDKNIPTKTSSTENNSSSDKEPKSSSKLTFGERSDLMAAASSSLPSPSRPHLSRRFSMQIPVNSDANEHVEATHGKESWQYQILAFLHSKPAQTVIMIMLLLDVLILFAELAIAAFYPQCLIIVRDAISCCPSNNTNEDKSHHRFLGTDDHYHNDVCDAGLLPTSYEAGCDPHKWHVVHQVETVLFSITLIILFTMFIELNLAVAALSPAIFFRQFFYALDYLIVSVSIILEFVAHFVFHSYEAISGVLIFIRMWRFVRISHGLMDLSAELMHQRYVKLLNYAEDLEKLLKENNLECPYESSSIKDLKDDGDLLLTKIRQDHHCHSHH